MNERMRHQLSAIAQHDEYCIPRTPLGEAVCKLPLRWAKVGGLVQPIIHMAGVEYPDCRLLTRKEAADEA